MASRREFRLTSKVIVFPGFGAWRFIHLDKKTSEKIRAEFEAKRAGFGSIRIEAKIGKTVWKSSIFPDKKSGTYLLPLKAAVRKAEQIDDEDTVSFIIKIL